MELWNTTECPLFAYPLINSKLQQINAYSYTKSVTNSKTYSCWKGCAVILHVWLKNGYQVPSVASVLLGKNMKQNDCTFNSDFSLILTMACRIKITTCCQVILSSHFLEFLGIGYSEIVPYSIFRVLWMWTPRLYRLGFSYKLQRGIECLTPHLQGDLDSSAGKEDVYHINFVSYI